MDFSGGCPVSSITPESPFRGNRISRDAFRLVLDINAALPVIQERDASEYYDAIVATGVDPLFILAMFEHESQMGHAGVARVTHSWGNTRKPSFGAVPVGETPGASGTFPIFATWLDGCISDRKSTRLNSSHSQISYAVFCLKKT